MKGYYQHQGIWYPEYPNLGAKVAKLRWGADRKAHGEAVLEAIRAKHRMRPTPSKRPNPIRMKGDPKWNNKCNCRQYGKCICSHWGAREQAVYAAMIEEKRARS